jgi:hypothetical protein
MISHVVKVYGLGPPANNGHLRDECLNEHWFLNLAHAQAVIEAWSREYNEERPKKALGGLTPSACAGTWLRNQLPLLPDSKQDCYSRWGDVKTQIYK